MKRVIIICEGQTEQEFCNKILLPYLLSFDVCIETPLIKHSHGGIVHWNSIKRQITNHLVSDKTVYVTLFIDYYGISSQHGFPKWHESEKIMDKNERISFLKSAMKNDIDKEINFRFLPYIQLHEFEGLLFSGLETFKEVFGEKNLMDVDLLQKTFSDFSNPEMINSGKETSPSHRLKRIVKGYDKIVYGSILAESIGLKKIMDKCPGFCRWVKDIASLT